MENDSWGSVTPGRVKARKKKRRNATPYFTDEPIAEGEERPECEAHGIQREDEQKIY
jgi:hypothetical protein